MAIGSWLTNGWRRAGPMVEWALGVCGVLVFVWQVFLVGEEPLVIELEPLDERVEQEWRTFVVRESTLAVARALGAADAEASRSAAQARRAADASADSGDALAASGGGESVAASTTRRAPSGPRRPVDLNAASSRQLQRLPGVGPAIAERIVAGRPYGSVEELVRVRGIGPATLERLRPFVQVAGDREGVDTR